MMEKLKTWLLVGLVALSLIQSYLLVYSFPTIGATVQTEQEYITAERMGETSRIDDLIFPEEIVLHMGSDRHAVLYPDTGFYERIYELLQTGEYRNFRRVPNFIRDWDNLRRTAQGVELNFGGGVPVSLLQKSMRLDGDFFFLGDSISSIWLLQRKFQGQDVSEVYFFSSDGETIYEPSRAALSPDEIKEIAELGTFMPPYTLWRDGIYIPSLPLEAVEYSFGYASYSPQQMQRSLFFDPDRTRYLEDRNGSVIYTDGKRGLQLESGDTWMVFTNPVPPQDSPNNLADNAITAVQFVNQHGGWDGRYRFQPQPEQMGGLSGRYIAFQQYYNQYPLIGTGLQYGKIQMQMQQGTASVYERSLITRSETYAEHALRWLPGGERLQHALNSFARSGEIEAVLPALQVSLTEDQKLYMEPAWSVRLSDGSLYSLMKAMPRGTVVDLDEAESESIPAGTKGTPAGGSEEAGRSQGDTGSDEEATEADEGDEAGVTVDGSADGIDEPEEASAGAEAGNDADADDPAALPSDGTGAETEEIDVVDAADEGTNSGGFSVTGLPTTDILNLERQ